MDDSTELVHTDPAHHRGDEQRAIDRLWDFGDPVASETRFRAAAEGSPTEHERAVMRTQVARALGVQRRLADALAELDALEAARFGRIAEPPTDAAADAPGDAGAEAAEITARIELERGRALAESSRTDDAVEPLTRAVRAAAAAGSTFLVLDALHLLALHDAGHEREWADEALELLAAERDPRSLRWGVALHNNLGWTLHDGGDAEAGLEQFRLAVAAADRYGSLDQQQVARWSVGRALRTLGRVDEALALQRELAAVRPTDPWVRAELDALDALAEAGSPTTP